MSNPPHDPSTAGPKEPLLRAEALLQACVHCGFCNATCPTYIVSGDEREGPRGRLYLMKDWLTNPDQSPDLAPLDHCLSCRSCETTCPAGVHYTEILDIVREETEKSRGFGQRAMDQLTAAALSSQATVGTLMTVARRVRPLVGESLKRRIRKPESGLVWPEARHPRRVGLLLGCVQPALAPDLDTQAAIVLDRLGISAVPVGPGCCGALPYHLHSYEKARATAQTAMRWDRPEWEGFTSTATGCTAFLRDYPRLFKDQADTKRAHTFAPRVADIATWIDPTRLAALPGPKRRRIAWQAPCSLQHGLRSHGQVEAILKALGHTLVPIQDSALCCGSAGPYSLRYPRWARALGQRKWQSLIVADPAEVVSANIGCLQHLAGFSDRPIRHWIDVVYHDMQGL